MNLFFILEPLAQCRKFEGNLASHSSLLATPSQFHQRDMPLRIFLENYRAYREPDDARLEQGLGKMGWWLNDRQV